MKTKLNLKSLEVKSFIPQLSQTQYLTINGGKQFITPNGVFLKKVDKNDYTEPSTYCGECVPPDQNLANIHD